jgi:hypothetical protein
MRKNTSEIYRKVTGIKDRFYVDKKERRIKMANLKKCPFCGEDADLVELRMTHTSLWDVTCTGPDCKVGPNVGASDDMQEVIDAWNKRAPQPMTMGG